VLKHFEQFARVLAGQFLSDRCRGDQGIKFRIDFTASDKRRCPDKPQSRQHAVGRGSSTPPR
jgi:hypothetical protein